MGPNQESQAFRLDRNLPRGRGLYGSATPSQRLLTAAFSGFFGASERLSQSDSPLGGIGQYPALLLPRSRRRLRGLSFRRPKEVQDRVAMEEKIVGDDLAVTAPLHRFGTHDWGAVVGPERVR